MIRSAFILVCALVPALCLGSVEGGSFPRADNAVALTNATVIDVVSGTAIPKQTIVINGDRIQAVGPTETVTIPAGAERVDASGRYVIPGLWDMHVHSANFATLPLFVANGVTGVRVMWGNPTFGGFTQQHFALRKQIEEGKVLGPRLVVASNIMDGPEPIWPNSLAVKSEAQAREEVQKAKKAGADFIKVYSKLGKPEYMAIADESRELGIPFAGHVPESITAAEASDAGQKTFEHLYSVLLGCSSKEAEIMAARVEASKPGRSEAEVRTLARNRSEAAAASYDPAKAAALFAKFKKNGTYQCPTLTVLRSFGKLDDPKFTSDPRLKYMSPFFRQFWDPKNDFRLKSMKPEDFGAIRKSFDRSLELVGAMQKAGVLILAGTDEMNPYCFPGFSLHDELALFVKAGLSPAEALQTATINPARYLHEEKTIGTVESGKTADLVVLDADPLADIQNSTKIHEVFVRGKRLDRRALDQLLENAEQAGSPKAKTPAK